MKKSAEGDRGVRLPILFVTLNGNIKVRWFLLAPHFPSDFLVLYIGGDIWANDLKFSSYC